MPHTFTPEPIKNAIDTRIFRPLKDGLLIDWNDQFKLRVVHAPVTQEKLNEALKNHLKFVICRDIIDMNHKKFGEKSYYTNLGLCDPRADFRKFREYAEASIEKCNPEMREMAEQGYISLCKANNVTGDTDKVFG
tara:strand:+ start:142 stop:546 length:405 start_codon:yes stop_codon:yes gene_type:complete